MGNSKPLPKGYQSFSDVLAFESYEPLPNEWLIGVTDVVGSTAATTSGRYRDVNYAGACVIAALGNALGSFDFPSVFRGDGAAFVLSPDHRMTATTVLQQVAAFAGDCLGLTLRTGLVSIGIARGCGADVRMRRYSPSRNATYYMFAGGGLSWADEEIKRGRYLVMPGMDMEEPDLTGLACEWAPIASGRGEILSLLLEPSDHTRPDAFSAIAKRVMDVLQADSANPLPVVANDDPSVGMGRFIGIRDWSDVVMNTDYRKYDDVLRMTLDCTPEQIDEVERILMHARTLGHLRYGLHRQSHALMTCLVPSANPNSHRHFLDGMGGGYAKAAEMLVEWGSSA
jgi:hypothetical protein